MTKWKWSDDRVERLRALHAQGYSCRTIAKMLTTMTGVEVSRNAVLGKLSRLGLMGTELQRERRHARAQQAVRTKRGPKPVATAKPKKPWTDEPYTEKGAERGEWNVRFLDRAPTMCPRFVSGEEGARGLVCGRQVSVGSYCSSCAKLLYVVPVPPARVA